MAIKHFKIGEYCAGGVISAHVSHNEVILIQRDWDLSQGSRRSDCKIANCQEIDRVTVNPSERGAYWTLRNWLEDITSSGWADTVIGYLEEYVTLMVF